MTVEIVNGAARDVDGIMGIMTSAFAPGFGEAWSANQCRGVLILPGSRLSIACVLGQPAGFALWRWVLDEAEILLIATDPELQKSRIGTALLNHVMATAKAEGVIRLHVEVRSDNPALSFYESHLFSKVGVRPNYYLRSDDGPRDAYTLCRIL